MLIEGMEIYIALLTLFLIVNQGRNMKKTLFFCTSIIFLSFIFWSSSVFWLTVSDPVWLVDCMQTHKNLIPNYANFYHENDGVLPIEKTQLQYWNTTGIKNIIVRAENMECTYEEDKWNNFINTQMIPVYHPTIISPIAFQAVYMNSGWVFQWVIPVINGSPRKLPLFYWGIFEQYSHMTLKIWNHKPEAYLKSLEEPFRSAPTLQMYTYLGSPLLVARSQTGMVTDVFFQREKISLILLSLLRTISEKNGIIHKKYPQYEGIFYGRILTSQNRSIPL